MKENKGKKVLANEYDENLLVEKVLQVKRVTKVVKGGRRFSFSALVIVGNKKGKAGFGFGKANDISDAIKKATDKAKKGMVNLKIRKSSTLPHDLYTKFKASKIILKPASPGTGLITGGTVKSILEIAGYKDVLSKIVGSRNKMNIVRATFKALQSLRTIDEIASSRSKKNVSDLWINT